MPELRAGAFDVVSCHAAASSCDVVMGIGGAFRVAPDEVMIVGARGTAAGLVGRVAEVVDTHAVVIDATDGWTAWGLGGAGSRLAFSYLSALELPEEGFVQGEVANLPAKVIAGDDEVHILVPAMLGDEMRRRIVARCGHLALTVAAS